MSAAPHKAAQILCPYCDHEYRPADYSTKGMQQALMLHVRDCPTHPISKLLQVLKSGRDLLTSEPSLGLRFDSWVERANEIIAAAELVTPKKPRSKR